MIVETISAAEALLDGDFKLNDITLTASVGISVIGVAMDPVGACCDEIAGVVVWLVQKVLEHFGPTKRVLDSFLGDPDGIDKNSQRWRDVGRAVADLENRHADSLRMIPTWHGEARDAYAGVHKVTTTLYPATNLACTSFGAILDVVAVGVAVLKQMFWDGITKIVSAVVKAILNSACGPLMGVKVVITESVKCFKWISEKLKEFDQFLGDRVGQLTLIGEKLLEAGQTLGKVLKEKPYATLAIQSATNGAASTIG